MDVKFGIASLIDWDQEAMTDIEGIRSGHVGGIDRSESTFWRTMGKCKDDKFARPNIQRPSKAIGEGDGG